MPCKLLRGIPVFIWQATLNCYYLNNKQCTFDAGLKSALNER
jgi:hypothetical protein